MSFELPLLDFVLTRVGVIQPSFDQGLRVTGCDCGDGGSDHPTGDPVNMVPYGATICIIFNGIGLSALATKQGKPTRMRTRR